MKKKIWLAIIFTLFYFSSAKNGIAKSPEEIFQESDYPCIIFTHLKVKGKTFAGTEVARKFPSWGSCFLIESRGENYIITAAHIIKETYIDKQTKEDWLKIMNNEIMPGIASSTSAFKNLWKEITEIKDQNGWVAFKSSSSVHYSLKDNSKISLSPLDIALGKYDEKKDIAVFRLKNPSALKNIQAGKLGDSDKIRVGEEVISIASPENLIFSLFSGRVASLGIDVQKYIITSAMIGYGSSGGPLINKNGEIVGMATQIYQWIPHPSVFIPSNTIKEFLESK